MNLNNKKIAEKTLILLNKKPWGKISLLEIKKNAKIKNFDKIIYNKKDLLINLNKFFDFELSARSKNIENSNKKDMVFEILMMRFDIIQIHRKGMVSIFNSFKKKPNELIFLLPNLLNSVDIMLDTVNFSSKGFLGHVKIKSILIIYILTFFVWINDEGESLEKTMTSLDNFLDKFQPIFKFN